MARHTLLTDFLSELEVPHTSEYSDRVYRNMPFKSLFGLAYALKSYNIESTGYKCAKPADVITLTPPFMARTSAGTFVIITKISDNTVEYLYNSKHQSSPRDEFQARLDGTVFMAFPTDKSREPNLGRHEFVSFITRCRNLALALGPLALVILGGIYTDVFTGVGTTLVCLLNIIGILTSVLLIKKTWHVDSSTADRVCGVVQHGGCDHVLSSEGAKLFGVFSWSEIGLSYFSVSLIAMSAFPGSWPWLALFNICCLPYSFWSIWYQHYRAQHWCTLCLSVQATLWLSFLSWLISGTYSHIAGLDITDGIILVLAYISATCILSAVTSMITAYTTTHQSNSTPTQ